MKKLSQILCSISFFFVLFDTPVFGQNEFIGNVKVIDGDTIILNKITIRFSGIDAPESFFKGKSQVCNSLINDKKFFCGKLAKKKLKEKVKNKIVTCLPEYLDRYKRVIAECFVNGESLSSYMVKSGFAFDYVKYSNGKFENDQNFAKENKLGLWNSKFDYPWVWRKLNK